MTDGKPVWQPIETAPKNVEILAWYPPAHGDPGFRDVIVVTDILDNVRFFGVLPTKWTPLPEPPEEA